MKRSSGLRRIWRRRHSSRLDAFLRPFQAGDRADIHLAAGLVPRKIHLYDGKQGIDAGVLEAPENIGQLPVDILPQAGGFK